MTKTLRKNQTLLITLAVLTLLYLFAVRGMSSKDAFVTTLRGLSQGSVLFLAASGLSLIFGLMDVLNLAHGALFMLGAYIGWSVYVRPDTFVDLLTPLALLAAGFVLMPLWEDVVGRLRISTRAMRVFPWIGLFLAGVIAALIIPRVPLAAWDPEIYDNSPIIWTQHFTSGQVQSMVEPAGFENAAPIVAMGGLLLAGCLAAISLAGFSRTPYEGSELESSPYAQRIPWKTIIIFFLVLAIGIGAYLANDALTDFLLSLDSTWLFLTAVVTAVLIVGFLGALMEVVLIRPLYARPIYQLMLTLGLGVIGVEAVRALWGRTGFTMPRPSVFAGSGDPCPATNVADWFRHRCSTLAVTIGEETTRIRVYNEIFVILVGVAVLVIVWILIQRTRLGMTIRAGVQDSEMVEALGINVRRVFTLVFALGTGLAALGGVLSGPSTGLSDVMGGNLLLGALIALAIGGLTSFPGAALGAVIVGLLQQFIIKYGQIGIDLPVLSEPIKPSPTLVPASTVFLMVVILLVMPQGLLGRKE